MGLMSNPSIKCNRDWNAELESVCRIELQDRKTRGLAKISNMCICSYFLQRGNTVRKPLSAEHLKLPCQSCTSCRRVFRSSHWHIRRKGCKRVKTSSVWMAVRAVASNGEFLMRKGFDSRFRIIVTASQRGKASPPLPHTHTRLHKHRKDCTTIILLLWCRQVAI